MDYDKLELEVYDLIKSMLSQARLQVSIPQARAYSMEVHTLMQSIKAIQELMILKEQLKSIKPPEK